MKKLTVAKFGGTSVADRASREYVMERIREIRSGGSDVVVVISAMGRKGAPYSTDTLLSLIREEPDPRVFDLLVSCGEIIAACVLSDELQAKGIPAEPLTGAYAGIKTDGVFSRSKFVGMDTTRVRSLLAEGVIPVITGYQGAGPDGFTTTMGRGSSDLSAVEIGAYLKADEVLIYTDVPGIAKADPRVWKDAPFIGRIDCGDILALASWGFKVIHPGAVSAGMRAGIPVSVLSTFSSGKGTVICELPEPAEGFIGAALLRHFSVGPEESELPLGGGLFASPGGDRSVITVLSRPAAAIPAGLLPEDASALEDNGLIHIIVSDGDADETLRKICVYLS